MRRMYMRDMLDVSWISNVRRCLHFLFLFFFFFMIALAFKAVSQRQRRVVADIAKAA